MHGYGIHKMETEGNSRERNMAECIHKREIIVKGPKHTWECIHKMEKERNKEIGPKHTWLQNGIHQMLRQLHDPLVLLPHSQLYVLQQPPPARLGQVVQKRRQHGDGVAAGLLGLVARAAADEGVELVADDEEGLVVELFPLGHEFGDRHAAKGIVHFGVHFGVTFGVRLVSLLLSVWYQFWCHF